MNLNTGWKWHINHTRGQNGDKIVQWSLKLLGVDKDTRIQWMERRQVSKDNCRLIFLCKSIKQINT